MLWVVMRRGRSGDVVVRSGGRGASAWRIVGVDLGERLEAAAKRETIAQCVMDILMRLCYSTVSWSCCEVVKLMAGKRRRLSGSEI